MLIVKYASADAGAAVEGALRGQAVSLDQYNALIASLASLRDTLRVPGVALPRVPYAGPDEALRGTLIPLVGSFELPSTLAAAQVAGNTATSQDQYLRARYSDAIDSVLVSLRDQRRLLAGVRSSGRSSAGLGTYEGPVELDDSVAGAAFDPLAYAGNSVLVPVSIAQTLQTLLAGLASVQERTAAGLEGRTVSPSAEQTAQTGLLFAEQLSAAFNRERAKANVRAVVVVSLALGAAYLWGRR